MGTRIEQLERQVEVLRDALEACADEHVVPGVASDALAEADRIAAEPVEETDWEIVIGWVSKGPRRFVEVFGDGSLALHPDLRDMVQRSNPVTFQLISEAAAWVRAQGVGND